MNPQVKAVQEAAAILRAAFPTEHVSLEVSADNQLSVHWFGCKTYADATVWLRSLNCGTRHKTPQETYTAINAVSPEGIRWATFPDELPPTCRKVKKIERVPKTQTITTGEFVEIEREVVECGPDPDEIVAANALEAKGATA
jgi:hypothetical protein